MLEGALKHDAATQCRNGSCWLQIVFGQESVAECDDCLAKAETIGNDD